MKAKVGLLYKTDGSMVVVKPKNGTDFKYEELRTFVGGMVEIVPTPNGRLIVVNEEGKLIGLPYNNKGSDIWKSEYPISEYPNNNDETIVGDMLYCEKNLIK